MVEDALKLPEAEKEALPTATITEPPFPPKHRRKAKGPNPLSVKKKQPKAPTSIVPTRAPGQEELTRPNGSSLGQKRRRDESESMEDDHAVPAKKKRRRRKPVDGGAIAVALGSE